MKILNQIQTYDPDVDITRKYSLEIGQEDIIFSLIQDHVEYPNGVTVRSLTPRAVKIELRPDGGINVLSFAADKDEPYHIILASDGSLTVVPA